MVAYSFKAFFEQQISTLIKRQTVRADRARHARVGETVQLYVGMRTRNCRKILKPDPACIGVLPIVIEMSAVRDDFIAGIEVAGCRFNDDDIETFARDDGFAPERINAVAIDLHGKTARHNMGEFWQRSHEGNRFTGVVIKWKPGE